MRRITITSKSPRKYKYPLVLIIITPYFFNARMEVSGRVAEGVTTKINKWRCRM